ncbi:COMM domain-containing protein 2 [Trichogramma pretiosum]|uniref:COMM domain-containing protein 2 n=1 Tax=Trichogramma pretiosum TaxID=7493 RepID=UPI0006C99667|nr:COMM domain-containing protein 2 [Trichogramma pretiosum]
MNITDDLRRNLAFLIEQSHVLPDFCKLAIDYLQKGPNLKIYSAAAQKLQVEPKIIRSSVEALLNFLFECCKNKLSIEDLKETISSLGFPEEHGTVLCDLYTLKSQEISDALSNLDLKLPEYHNLEWRFEAQIASRSLLHQVIPLITMDLALANTSDSSKLEHVYLQTDPNNLLHLAQELEIALREGRSRHVQSIARIVESKDPS